MHVCFETNIFDILEMLSKLHYFDIFPKHIDDKNLKRLCDVFLPEPSSTSHITFNLETPNGGG
jgi:hypothetical protein